MKKILNKSLAAILTLAMVLSMTANASIALAADPNDIDLGNDIINTTDTPADVPTEGEAPADAPAEGEDPADDPTEAGDPEETSDSAVDYTEFDLGPNVKEDPTSPTGYTVTFVYEEQSIEDYYNKFVSYNGSSVKLSGSIDKIELYSDCFMQFDPNNRSLAPGTGIKDYAGEGVSPYEYEKGMVSAGGNIQTAINLTMTKTGQKSEAGKDLWVVSVPLSSGAFVYNYRVFDTSGKSRDRLDDPHNPTMVNTVTKIHSLSSMVYVPYDADKQGDGQWADRSVELPREDNQTGTVEFFAYQGANPGVDGTDETERGVAVYLPADYDAKRVEPYKVLYISMGMSGDKQGNELRWLNEGAVPNIMDNLIAEGKTEPFLVVSMNHQDLGERGFDYEKVWAEYQRIEPLIEQKYNVGKTQAYRGFAGLSAGGMTTTNMLGNHPEHFSYYGIWSGTTASAVDNNLDKIKEQAGNINVHLGSGLWDGAYTSTHSVQDTLNGLGVSTAYTAVPAAHDWEAWQLLFADAAENFFWKKDAVDYSKYEPGVTVEKDANSPTGYTATFIYKEQTIDELNAYVSYNSSDPQNIPSTVTLSGGVAKVEIYSDCFALFDLTDEEMEKGVAIKNYADRKISPYRYRAGLAPAGGNGETAISIGLTNFDKEKGLWGVQVPLSSGAFVYNYRITDTNGVSRDRYQDPANPTLWNEATDIHSLSSMVYVPYDKTKQGAGQWADRSVELPRTDGKTGKVVTVSYEGANIGPNYETKDRGLAIYLPYGYDAERTEPYKVLYISMGTSGDHQGNEMRWLNEGAAANIMDNLIAEGKAEPFIIVSMNNQDLGTTKGGGMWDKEKAWEEQELIFKYMEKHYNVGKTSAYRAYAGLSQGGGQTAYMLAEHTDAFDYYGVYSAGSTTSGTDVVSNKINEIAEHKDRIHVYAGTGYWDNLYNESLYRTLSFKGVDSMFVDVPGAHDWEAWQLLLADSVENFFWKGNVGYSDYTPGVTVEKDADSPTGYTAVFVFDEKSVKPADYGLKDIAKVQVYSDGMLLFSYDEQKKGTPLDPKQYAHDPDEFKIGMYPAGGDTSGDLYGGKKICYYANMTEFSEGMWGIKIPLTSGATYYNYRLTDSDGKADTGYIDDPANPTMTNTASKVKSRSSMVYVPYDPEKMGAGQWADRTVENPRTDDKVGEVKFASYTGAEEDTRYLGIYLPYGYDENREKPYNVLYMSHGAQSEQSGCELRWLNECAAANIMDNLEGDFIVVTMNNTDLGWDINKIWAEQQLIMAYMEKNYYVGKTAESRGFAGLSMGGITASRMYAHHADQFGYFGIWSAADASVLTKLTAAQKEALAKQDCKISLGAGDWDYALSGVETFGAQLNELGIAYDFLTVPGSHDWRTWQAMLAETVENFFWKDTADYSDYEKGVTVEEDENSPTGYTATFIYEDKAKSARQVELYSDCFYHFTEKDGFDTPYTPDQFAPGMYPAGGNAGTTCYVNMKSLGNNLWAAQIPLSSGAFVYNFRVTATDGTQTARLDDPNNPTLKNEATGISSLSSMVYVPYDEAKQGTGDWVDRSVELPQADKTKRGTVETVAYTGAAGDTRGLAVYLPAGYDKNRAEPYKVLYLSHGASGDRVGNELRWMNEGAVANIMDNLIAAGKNEPFVVVTMNNQDLGWSYEKIEDDQFNHIMPFIEAKYNVSKTAEGRAYAGLSMGGLTTNRMYFNHGADFSYFGIFSHASTGAELANIGTYSNLRGKGIMLGSGIWDGLTKNVDGLAAALDAQGIGYNYVKVPAAHDWEAWQLLYASFVENYLWKEKPADQGNNTGGGSSSTSGTSTETTKNADGSTTVKVTDKGTGTVTETTTYPDGTKGVTVTKKDGTVTAEVTLPKTAEGTVTLPVKPLSPGATVTVKTGQTVKVLIPVANAKPGIAAVLVKADGSEELVKKSVTTADGIVLTLDGSATLKLVDNSKSFADVTGNHWAADAVAFAVSRELFQGIGGNTFAPAMPMTRSMLVTVLYRLENEPEAKAASFTDVPAGTWYSAAVGWADEQGIVTGTGAGFDPDGNITRESLAAILYRYAKVLGLDVTADGALDSYADGGAVSAWASDAMKWAVGAGIITGKDGGKLDPSGTATRAEVATMLMRFVAAIN